ncbi:conserved hypothetical protein [Halorhabdus utahensis DSM 12940]|uniref:Uncharacterized protein n=1 Tax=Halorhabdus utahensis (strain DSM 12940 / JCM 11049 / AX-2) TaxID=519442 RepID=C7NR31_HALUD|nr:DUF5794 domain-containing protein [Halorhabdus utahensis]ACV12944.1 conserved hypothetical protein [Halorhabdus utahensis DSM 12940]
MSSSQHPIALAIERRVGGDGRLLATVMCLPLVDGVFPALILAGAVGSFSGIFEVGLLVFGGSATVAVILADMDGSPREQALTVAGVGVVLLPIAALEAALAPTIASVLDLAIFERFAGLVILAIAAQTASSQLADVIPRPAVIVGFGLVASLDLNGAEFSVATDPGLVINGTAAALVGVGFALLVALTGPWLRASVDLDRFRFGSAVALGVLALSVYGLVPSDAPLSLAVLAMAGLLAFDPDRDLLFPADDAGREPENEASLPDGGDQSDAPNTVGTDTKNSDDRSPWL